jgi:hypothetical protein
MQAAALSEDGPVDDVQKHRRGESKRALQHAGGSNRPGGRLAAYIQPLPLDYQKLDAGFQQFIQAAGTLVWKRRIFTYAADCKVGALLTERPDLRNGLRSLLIRTSTRYTGAPLQTAGLCHIHLL